MELNTTTTTNGIEADPEFGNPAKILAIFALGLGSILSGLAPRCISLQNRRRFPFVISLLLCFGAGVLLATALIHMLPDVRKVMEKNAELYMSLGFFIIYFIDEFIHYFFGESLQHTHEPIIEINNQRNCGHSHGNYGSITETDPLLNNQINQQQQNDQEHQHDQHKHHHDNHNHDEQHCDLNEANARICHVSHREPCLESKTGVLGLLVALSLHSYIEGLAIGVQNTKSGVLLLLTAVACHKYVMGFCLGLEICSNLTSTLKSHIISIVVFALGSSLGILTGMALIDMPLEWTNQAMPILQALAGGTLLYVTVCEVMPRERSEWHLNRTKKIAGLGQFLAVSIGFSLMTLINFYMDND